MKQSFTNIIFISILFVTIFGCTSQIPAEAEKCKVSTPEIKGYDYECVANIAIERKNASFCREVLSGEASDNCIYSYARKTNDSSACDIIDSIGLIGICYSDTNGTK